MDTQYILFIPCQRKYGGCHKHLCHLHHALSEDLLALGCRNARQKRSTASSWINRSLRSPSALNSRIILLFCSIIAFSL